MSDSVLYIAHLDNQGFHFLRQPLQRDSLRFHAKQLHEALSDFSLLQNAPKRAYHQFCRSARWCYKKLLAPILDKDKHSDRLIILPDGELSHLPFEVFLMEDAPEDGEDYAALAYLVRKYALSYNFSAQLWLDNQAKAAQANNGQLLAIAANYPEKASEGGDSSSVFRAAAHLALRRALRPLKAAREEVEALQMQYAGHFVFDTLASERFFKQEAPKYAILHLAMHGLLDAQNPLLSALAFTENGDSAENNLLQAYEISQLRLSADLVVLSACETGYGKFEAGNGTASLARAFMYAGVPALLVSLWSVNDQTTSILMQNFYAQLYKGLDKDKALQQAKIDYLQNARGVAVAPAFWAAFVQIGNTQPLHLQPRNNYIYILLLVATIGLALAGRFLWKYKKVKSEK